MRKILLAYLFLLIDLELIVNVSYFSLLIPMVGVMLLLAGLSDVANENEQFEQCVPYVVGMLFLRILLFVCSLLQVLPANGIYRIAVSLVVLIFFFGITNRMLCVFREIEEENNLFSASRFCMVGEMCLFIIGLVGIWINAVAVRPSFFALSVIACGLFFVALYQLQIIYLRFEQAL